MAIRKRCKTCQFTPCRCVDLAEGFTLTGQSAAAWPMVSTACAVHPKQVKEASELAAKRGVPTEFRKDGRPVFRDRAHRASFLKAHGLFDRSAGYRDPTHGDSLSSLPDGPHLDRRGYAPPVFEG